MSPQRSDRTAPAAGRSRARIDERPAPTHCVIRIDLSFVVVGAVAFAVSCLTLFSGFGLGTLLMPAFALFFPVEVAVGATAVVHVLNNLFKVALLRRHVARRVLLRFGLPAVAAAPLGAWLLAELAGLSPLLHWRIGPREAVVTPVALVMGALIFVFAAFELVPSLAFLRPAPRWLPLGGAVSGFFGGLSGHQGALRAAFLGSLALDPAAFAATQAVIACMVDASRLLVYGIAVLAGRMGGLEAGGWSLVGVATVCAFAGAWLGARLLPRVTLGALRVLVGALLLVVGIGLAAGLL